MVLEIQSKEVIDKISDELKLQPVLQIPRELAKDIQLVYAINANPLMLSNLSMKNATATDAVTAQIHVTHATKRTFLVGVSMSTAKDVASDATVSTVNLTPKGQPVQAAIAIRYEPLTAGQFTETIMLPIPIELEKGSTIDITNSTDTASIDTIAIIYFYETDPQ